MNETKKETITELYRSVFSAHPWKYKPEKLTTMNILGELDFMLGLRSGTILTIEKPVDQRGECNEVIGVRIVSDMKDVVDYAEPELHPLLVALGNRLGISPKQVSYTHTLGVREDYRDNGVGSKLVEKHIEHARSEGAKVVIGWTVPENKSMINLYKKYGYIELDNLRYNGVPIDFGIDFDYVNGKPKFVKDSHIIGKVVYFVKNLDEQKSDPLEFALR